MGDVSIREVIDNVNHPPHYKNGSGPETIQIIEWLTSDLVGIQAVDLANVVKYISRWYKKNGVEDLKKASWYLNHLIATVETHGINTIKEDING